MADVQRLELVEPDQSKYIASKLNSLSVDLLPYVRINGEYTLPDYVVAGVFNQLIEDGTAKTVFQDGEICSGGEFVRFMQREKILPVFAFIDNQIVGVAWLNNIGGKHAFGHFAFFKSIWKKHTRDVGQAVLNYWFMLPGYDGTGLFDVILGFVPENNRPANRFIQRLGFTTLGVIPSMCFNAFDDEYQPGVLSYIER